MALCVLRSQTPSLWIYLSETFICPINVTFVSRSHFYTTQVLKMQINLTEEGLTHICSQQCPAARVSVQWCQGNGGVLCEGQYVFQELPLNKGQGKQCFFYDNAFYKIAILKLNFTLPEMSQFLSLLLNRIFYSVLKITCCYQWGLITLKWIVWITQCMD